MTGLLATLSKVGRQVARNIPDDPIDVAKLILEMRAAGRAGDVTEEMMARADPQFMFANTPLPMDEASRMARAGDRLPVYHRTSSDFDAFDLGKSQSGEAVFVGPDAGNLQQKHNRKAVGDSIMPLLLKADNRLELDDFNSAEMRDRYSDSNAFPFHITENTAQKLKDADFDAIVSKQGDGLPNFNTNEIAVLRPENLRSRFARFDPEFSHLRDLSASSVPASLLGILGWLMGDNRGDRQ